MSDPAEASVFFVGNATTVIRCMDFTVLTDPSFLHRGQRAYLGWGISTRRRTNPAIGIAQLPPLDAVVLSHLHGDHWDRYATEGLDQSLPIITTPQAATWLRRKGFRNATGLHTWQNSILRHGDSTLRITALPGRHAPPAARMLVPPVMGSMLQFGRDGDVRLRMHISGDTLLYDRLAEIPQRFPEIDVALVHLGGTTILGVLMTTMDGDQGARWVRLMGADVNLPIHYDDYDAFASGLDDFREHVDMLGLSDRVRYIARGETFHVLGHPAGYGAY
ncbi:MBL fold metallo-hydrolase [Sphaerisporangium krabiense]|uniref:L-ascorbate metabolism protein UlaG (Beta-lactamase superfamily) n=1 Tax=Sphaerisporangium krabiense TaxID=763782 RepID=A0A7W8Z2Y4_9ACTN|nr:MBL fold metallo-hydrolase [Sphaerisporangium krabiense]MBB5626461.1 L-ascorbate metabolism protein UlaG (beta-lactamase superfamily) [Sphaerisporangium krabiense]